MRPRDLALIPLALLVVACAGGEQADGPPPADVPADEARSETGSSALIELWSTGTPAFGVFVPSERERGARGPDGERLPPLYTAEGGQRLAANPLLDYVFLNLEGSYDAASVSAVAEGLRGTSGVNRKALLVRIPPISRDGEDAARARVVEALEHGADGIVIPHVRSPDEARMAVSFFEAADATCGRRRTRTGP